MHRRAPARAVAQVALAETDGDLLVAPRRLGAARQIVVGRPRQASALCRDPRVCIRSNNDNDKQESYQWRLSRHLFCSLGLEDRRGAIPFTSNRIREVDYRLFFYLEKEIVKNWTGSLLKDAQKLLYQYNSFFILLLDFIHDFVENLIGTNTSFQEILLK